MQNKVFIFQAIFFTIFYNYENFINANPLVGHNVREVLPDEYPYVVCIARDDPSHQIYENILCTGTIISSSLVLTASTCIIHNAAQYQIQLITGSHIVQESPKHYPIWWIDFDQWATQRQVEFTQYNDILIAKIFGSFYNIAPIPITLISPAAQLNLLNTTMVGCGVTNSGRIPDVHQASHATIIPLSTCSEVWSYYVPVGPLHEKFMCTLGVPFTHLDNGDAGGPLILYNTIIALNLGARPIWDGVYHPGKVNLHLNIDFFSNFINDVMRHG